MKVEIKVFPLEVDGRPRSVGDPGWIIRDASVGCVEIEVEDTRYKFDAIDLRRAIEKAEDV